MIAKAGKTCGSRTAPCTCRPIPSKLLKHSRPRRIPQCVHISVVVETCSSETETEIETCPPETETRPRLLGSETKTRPPRPRPWTSETETETETFNVNHVLRVHDWVHFAHRLLYTAKLLFHQSPTRHSDYTVTTTVTM